MKFVAIANCATHSILFSYADPSVKRAFKDHYLKETEQVVIDSLIQNTIYDGYTDCLDGPSGTWHAYV